MFVPKQNKALGAVL